MTPRLSSGVEVAAVQLHARVPRLYGRTAHCRIQARAVVGKCRAIPASNGGLPSAPSTGSTCSGGGNLRNFQLAGITSVKSWGVLAHEVKFAE
jgi:hypothetical protein